MGGNMKIGKLKTLPLRENSAATFAKGGDRGGVCFVSALIINHFDFFTYR
jgi:hypothetical protein